MKKLFYLFLSGFIFLLSSCEKKEVQAYFKGGTEPVLTGVTNTGTSSIALSPADSARVALSLSWTNPEYKFSYGTSSLDVAYFLEIDTAGSNFTFADRYQTTINRDLMFQMTGGSINTILTNVMGLATGVLHNLEVRLGSYIVTSGPGVDTLYSNIVKVTAVPFAPPPLVALPTTGELYLVGGDAKLGNWQNGGNDFAYQDQKFTMVTETQYTLTVELSGGDNTTDANQFLIIPKWGDWGHKYACKKTSEQPTTGGKFGYDWSDNFPGPPSAGTYKIDLDFQLGTYTVTKL